MAIEAHNALTTISNVKKGSSSASLELIRTRSGDIYFVDASGNRVLASGNDWAQRVFDAINALV